MVVNELSLEEQEKVLSSKNVLIKEMISKKIDDLKKEGAEEAHVCELCGQSFNRKSFLDSHMKIRHRNAALAKTTGVTTPATPVTSRTLIEQATVKPATPATRLSPKTVRAPPQAPEPGPLPAGMDVDLAIDVDDEVLDAILAMDLDLVEPRASQAPAVMEEPGDKEQDPLSRLQQVASKLDDFNDTITTFVSRLKEHGESLSKELRIILCELSSPFIADMHDA